MKHTMYLRHDFEVINYETSKGKALSTRCKNYDGYRLSEVYDKYSQAKQNAWEYWHAVYCDDNKSYNFSIVTHNRQTFSLGWFTTLPEPVDKGFSRDVSILITPTHNYMIVYPE